jgi:hypothetical protein
MSISDKRITELVVMLMRGISTTIPVDPEEAANIFQGKIEEIGGDYAHSQGVGYVTWEGDDVMLVDWQPDGVVFDDHHEHKQTLNVIRQALNTLNFLEEQYLSPEEDSSESDMEWI